MKKRDSIVASGNKITWTLTWNDLERFDSTNEVDRKDNLAFKQSYSNTLKTYQRIPYWQNYSSELINAVNSMERLIWVLNNPLITNNADKKIGLYLSLLQSEFAKPSCDNNEVEKWLENGTAIKSGQIALNKKDGAFYVFPNIYMDEAEFIKTTTAIRISDLDVKAKTIVAKDIISIDKEKWEDFWQIYNLIQANSIVQFESEVEILVTEDKYECLKYHDIQLHEIIRSLIDNDITFEKEGGFFINFEGGFAESMLGFNEPKFAILPLSEEDEIAFKNAGFEIILPEMFNINMLKK